MKIWELRNTHLSEADVLWITSNSMQCNIDFPHSTIGVRPEYIVRLPAIVRIITYGSKQEIMLRLKYGDTLFLASYTYMF